MTQVIKVKPSDRAVRWKRIAKNLLVMMGWAVSIAAIVLQAFYGGHAYHMTTLTTYGPAMTSFDTVLLLAPSALAGLIMVDAGLILLSCFAALGVSGLIVFLCIISPNILGIVAHPILQQELVRAAVIFIFRSFVPAGIILCLIGAVLGGIAGERLGFHRSIR